ncbi:hypothetical protein [Streptomyces sp. NPDC001089]
MGRTLYDHHRDSLRTHSVAVGMPDQNSLSQLTHQGGGIEQFTGPPGTATYFDSTCMHGSNGNVTPFPRSNIFIVFNSVDNVLGASLGASTPRPTHIAGRDFTPVPR